MNHLRLQSAIMRDEGFREGPYLDSVDGVPTIGFGTTRYLPGRPVSMNDPAISIKGGVQLMRSDLYGAILDAQSLFSRFDEMHAEAQEALCNMSYNLGKTRLAGFVRMIDAAKALDYDLMAEEAIHSRWYGQVGQRSWRIVQQIRGT